MFDTFTNEAKNVIYYAKQEAHKLGHEYIGTEHILLGLVQSSGLAAFILSEMEVKPRNIKSEIEKLVSKGTSEYDGQLPFTPKAKKVLKLALEESQNLNKYYVGAEHLLLGLLRDEESIGAKVLKNLDLILNDVREEVLEYLDAENDEKIEPRHKFTSENNETINLYDFREQTLIDEELVYVAESDWMSAIHKVFQIMRESHEIRLGLFHRLIPNISDKSHLLNAVNNPPTYTPDPVFSLQKKLFNSQLRVSTTFIYNSVQLKLDDILTDTNPQDAISDLVKLYQFKEKHFNSDTERDVLVWGVDWKDALQRSYIIINDKKLKDICYRIIPRIESVENIDPFVTNPEVNQPEPWATIPKNMLSYNPNTRVANLKLDRRIL